HGRGPTRREVEEYPNREVLAELPLLAGPRGSVAVGLNRALGHGRGAATDGALDAVPHHEVEPARGRTDNRLPAFHGPIDRPRHEGDLAQRVAAVGDGRGETVVLACMGKGLLIEGFEDDLHLLLEQFAIGIAVLHRGAEGLDFPRVIAAADAEYRAPLGENIG